MIDEVEQAFSQDEIIKKRMNEIKTGKVKGRSETDLNNYLKKRGLKID